jgi:DNA polymerase I
MSNHKRFFIIDAMAMAFRNFHAFGARPLTTSSGLPVSAIYGSAVFLMKLIEEERPDFLAIGSDCREPTFRHELYPQYKANRKEMPEDLAVQLPYLFQLFDAFGIPTLKTPGVEADDIIGTLVKKFGSQGTECFIVSGDKDFLQLVNSHISLYSPKKGGKVVITTGTGILDKFGCHPEQVIDILALIGDSSDNVPGVPGIGEKGAAKLINKYGSLDGIYENLEDISNKRMLEGLRNNKDLAYLSQKLVTIRTDLSVPTELEHFKFDRQQILNNTELLKIFEDLEFTGLTKRLTTLKATSQAKSQAKPEPKTHTDAVEPPERAREPVKFKSHCIADIEQLKTLCTRLSNTNRWAFDTETTGLDIVTDYPIGISLCSDSGEAYYLPLNDQKLPRQAVLEQLQILFQSTGRKIAHNLKFDLQMLRNIGIHAKAPYGDTMLLSYLLDSSSKKHGLDTVALTKLDHQMIPITALIGDKKELSMLDVPIKEITEYACEDAWAVWCLNEKLSGKLEQLGLTYVYDIIEIPLVNILGSMEQNGIFIDAEQLTEISQKLALQETNLQAEIENLVGYSFNINSPKQLQKVLFEDLKIHEQLHIKRLKKTKTGFSTDSSVLEQMSEHPLPQALLKFRTVTKLKNTYVDTLPQLINPKSGRIHTSFHQTGTATGRLSSSTPNLQNIPIRTEMGRTIRVAFSAPNKDRVMLSADYSQVELRILAHLAKEDALIEAFRNNEDIHRTTASKIFGIPKEEIDNETRNRAKAINFGIIYGMGPQRLAKQTGVSIAEAKIFIEKYFEGFPAIRTYIEESIKFAQDHRYTKTITGRRRPLPEIDAGNARVRVNAENIAVNSPVQGSAADLIKLAMIKIDKSLKISQLDCRMLIQVHDELVFEAARQDAPQALELIRTDMQTAMELNVPLLVEIAMGDNWLQAH